MRSYRELWLWLGAAFLALFAAFIAIGLAYFTKEGNFSFYTSWEAWASVAVFALGFACFACAILGAPFPPWTKVRFPNFDIEISPPNSTKTSYKDFFTENEVKATLMYFHAKITNLDSEQNASFTIRLSFKSDNGEFVAQGPNWFLESDPRLHESNLRLHMIQMPIMLAPGTTVGGDLVFDVTKLPGKLNRPMEKCLKVDDHIAKRQGLINIKDAPGRYGRDKLIEPDH